MSPDPPSILFSTRPSGLERIDPGAALFSGRAAADIPGVPLPGPPFKGPFNKALMVPNSGYLGYISFNRSLMVSNSGYLGI